MSDPQHHQLRTNRAAGPAGLHVERDKTGAPFVRLIAANGRVLAHSQAYSEAHEASQAVTTIERVVIEQAHPFGPLLYGVLRELDALDDRPDDPIPAVDQGFLDSVIQILSSTTAPQDWPATLTGYAAVLISAADALLHQDDDEPTTEGGEEE